MDCPYRQDGRKECASPGLSRCRYDDIQCPILRGYLETALGINKEMSKGICDLYDEGWTMLMLSRAFRITVNRVNEILVIIWRKKTNIDLTRKPIIKMIQNLPPEPKRIWVGAKCGAGNLTANEICTGPQCIFWEDDEDPARGEWSREGCPYLKPVDE